MKTLLVCLFVFLVGLAANAQSMLFYGTNNVVTSCRGGWQVDSLFRLPIRTHAPVYSLAGYLGRMQLSKSDSIPEYHNGKRWVKFNDYNELKHKPTIPTNNNQLINGSNFISGITSAMVIAALGFSPYSSANPSAYLSSEIDPSVPAHVKSISLSNINDWNNKQSALGFTPYNATNPLNFISIESDPTVPANVKAITATNISTWNAKQDALGFTPYNAINPLNFISIESDPTVPANVKAITATNISTWNAKQDALGFTPYNATNPAGYISSITNGMVTSALGFTPSAPITLNAGYGITISGGPTNFTISTTTPTPNFNPGRSANTNYTASTSRTVLGVYTVSCSVTNPLLVGTSSVTATHQISTNGGTTWATIGQNGASSAVGITVTLQLTAGQQGNIVVPIPANSLSRIVISTIGTASATIPYQIEIPL